MWMISGLIFYINSFLKIRLLHFIGKDRGVKNGKLIKSEEASKIFNFNIPKAKLPLWVNDWIKSDENNPSFIK